jgi:molybdopterin-guanine dinucleotide biosynthesis protein B
MRWVLMHELRGAPEPEAPEQLAHLSPCDLVLVEGFKRQPIPKLEVYRLANNTAPVYPTDARIVALATDGKLETALPMFTLDDYPGIANFIVQHLGLAR